MENTSWDRSPDLDLLKNEAETGHEKQEKTSVDRLTELLFEKFPQLKDVQVRRFVPEDDFDAGGFYDFEEIDGKVVPLIFISEGDSELLRPLLEIRRASIQVNADLLGIDVYSVTPQLLQMFIIAHEFGHIKDYVGNYESNPILEGWAAVEEMDSHRQAVLYSLPIPNLNPTHLAGELDGMLSIKEVLIKYPDLKKHPKFASIKSVADLLQIQEQEYRLSVPEKYADDFAAEFMRDNAAELGIDDLFMQIAA